MPAFLFFPPRSAGLRLSAAGLLTLLVVLGAPVLLAAESDRASAEPAPDLESRAVHEELSVTARALEIGAASGVVSREEIEASNVRSVAEVVGRLPGVNVVSAGSRGGLSTAQIRGGDPNFTLVLLDGVPLNDPTEIEGGAFNLSCLPIDAVDRIEILRGPSSYFFGSSALAGVIHLVTRRGEGDEPALRLRAEGGESSLFRTSAAVSGAGSRLDYYLGAGWEEEARRIGDDSFQQLNLQANVGFGLGDHGSTGRWSFRTSEWDVDDYPEASGGPVYGSGELRRSESRDASVGLHLDLYGSRSVRSSLYGGWTRTRVDRSSPAIFPAVPPSIEDRRYDRYQLGWMTEALLSDSIRITGGATVEREEAENRSTMFMPPMFGGEIDGDYRVVRTTPGGFVEIAAERSNLEVSAGLRADLPEEFATAWSPRLAVAYSLPDRGVLLQVRWSEAFKLPSTFALASPPTLGGNPDLEPERSRGLDLGLEVERPGGGVGFGVTLFQTVYEDLIDFDFDLFQSRNLDRVRARGIEAYLRWRPGPRWTLRSELTWQEVEDLRQDRPLLHHPDLFGGVGLTWAPRPEVTLSLDGRYLGPSVDSQIPVPQIDSVASAAVVDLAGSWRWTERLRLLAHVDNVADERYEQYIGFPAPGRSLRLGLDLSIQ